MNQQFAMLGVTVATAAALLAAPALAQSSSQATTETAEPEEDQPKEDTSEIVVTGLRESIRAAQNIKRRSTEVVEAITSRDLGRFTDSSISEAIARLPGVSISRNIRAVEGGDTITIRGLGPAYVTTTVNGRELLGNPSFFGGGARNFDFGSVPPEVLAGVVVYKTASAQQVEPGLGGQVDLKTLRPLDYRSPHGGKIFGTMTVNGHVDEKAEKLRPHVSGLIGAKLFNDTLGLYIGASYSQEKSRRQQYLTYSDAFSFSTVDALGATTQVDDALVPWGFDFFDVDLTYRRLAVSAAVQWKPTPNFELTADFLRNDFRTNQDANRTYYEVGSIFNLSPSVVAAPGAIILNGDPTQGAIYYDTRNLNAGENSSTAYAAHFRSRNRNTSYFAGLRGLVRDDSDRNRVIFDYVHGSLLYRTEFRTPYAAGLGGETVYDNRESRPKFTFINAAGESLTDSSTYQRFGFLEFFQKQARSTRDEFKATFQHEFSDSATLSVGGRLMKTDYDFVSANFNSATSATSLQNYFVPDKSRTYIFLNLGLPFVSNDGFCASNQQFCNQTGYDDSFFDGSFPTSVSGETGDVFRLNPGETYSVSERNRALFTQLDFRTRLFGIDWLGNAGVRAVNISTRARAFQGSQSKIGFTSAPVVPGSAIVKLVGDRNDYWKVLPSFNLTAQPTPDINLRFGVAKTISLPDYLALAPSGTATIVLPGPNGGQQPNQATVGNTQLKPTEAVNYDVTAEYYTSYGGAFIASLFRKDVTNLLTGLTLLNQTIPGQGSTLFNVNTTVNGARGSSRGFEVGTNQPFTFLPSPLDGFGLNMNYTFVDSKTSALGRSTSFPGTSKHNYSMAGYYEKYGFSLRLAYIYRTRYFSGRVGKFDLYVDPTSFLDLSASYKFTPNLEGTFTASNLLRENQTFRWDRIGSVHMFNELPRSYRFGVRATF